MWAWTPACIHFQSAKETSAWTAHSTNYRPLSGTGSVVCARNGPPRASATWRAPPVARCSVFSPKWSKPFNRSTATTSTSTLRPSGATSVRSVRNRRGMAPAKFASRSNAPSMRICCWWWTPSKKPPAGPSTKPAFAHYRLARPPARARKFGYDAGIWRSFMNTILFPLLVVWVVLALGVLTLFLWRQAVARNEDDSLHVMHGALTQQTSLSQKLDVIDKWGKILTVITVVLGLLLAAAYVYGQFAGRSSLGA